MEYVLASQQLCVSDAIPVPRVFFVRLPDGFTQLLSLTQLYLNDAFLEFLPASFGRSVCSQGLDPDQLKHKPYTVLLTVCFVYRMTL